MTLNRTGWTAALLAGVLALGGCTDGYGYSGVSVGAGSGGYGPGYYGGGPYGGYDYAPSYYGWYNDFYYPGTGVYVYDRYRRPYRWDDGQRAYWQGRRDAWRGGPIRDQWHGWGRQGWRGDRGFRPPPPAPGAERWRGGDRGPGFRGPPGGPRGPRGPR
ncbi:hypothetical protein RN629_00200 [Sphingomonadaceae bacterium jetA1]|jgi:hypothetical protein|uniref:hypothetical protein n=1 Tax=Facivitalis istanbulensis TaxID=3075838 RepID=UPI003489E7CD